MADSISTSLGEAILTVYNVTGEGIAVERNSSP